MLTLTYDACVMVRLMTDAPGVPETAGLRISAVPEGFAVSATPTPSAGDRTIEQDGALVHLDAATAERLDAMVLDAGIDDDGLLQFGLRVRASDPRG